MPIKKEAVNAAPAAKASLITVGSVSKRALISTGIPYRTRTEIYIFTAFMTFRL
jgi:hypothetical protein